MRGDGIQVAAYRALPRRIGDAFVRLSTANYTVGAICVVSSPDGEILLVRPSYREGWSVPGGLVRRRETPRDAAQRELREEVGLDLAVPESSRAEANPDLQTVTFVHRVEASAEQAAAATVVSPEITELAWAPLAALPPLYPPIRRSLRVVGLL
jgi:ADP-ribose pyrophosphatase YjhB (NUDIX family)